MTTLVVGVGHPDRGDDAAGWLVVDLLPDRPGRVVRRVTADPSGLLTDPLWTEAEQVIVVDAVRTGSKPGTILHWSRDQVLADAVPAGAGTHDLGLATTLGLAQALGRLPRDLTLIGIEAGHYAHGSAPSPAVLTAVGRVARSLDDEARWPVAATHHPEVDHMQPRPEQTR